MEVELKGFALTPEQTDTVALLDRLFGRAIANRYTDFCQLAASATDLRVTRPLAAHALRELESMLRSSLEVPMDAKARPAKDAQRAEAETALRALHYDAAAIQRALGALAPRLNHAFQIRLIAERLGLAAESDVVRAWVPSQPGGGFFVTMLLSGGPQRSTRAESPMSPEISPKEICQTVFG